MTRRIIAQRIKTGKILTWSVPLTNAVLTRELSGPGGITGIVPHKARWLLADDGQPLFEEWSTALYYEADGLIRGGGIVTRIAEDDQGRLRLEAPGFSTYPHGLPYTAVHRPGLGAEPLDVVRHIWEHVQSFPDGDLGLTVDDTRSNTVLDDTSDPEKPKPYVLAWWENIDCGQEINSLLDAAPADYIETHTWTGDRQIAHHLVLGVPRLGKKRHDLRFAEGENVVASLPLVIDGDDFAQNIVGLGRGEGRKMVRETLATRDHRLRRVAVVTDKAAGPRRIASLTRRELRRRSGVRSFDQVLVRDHNNARLSAISPGDDIEVEADLTWYGRTRLWQRVLAIEEPIDGDQTARLTVARSDDFHR